MANGSEGIPISRIASPLREIDQQRLLLPISCVQSLDMILTPLSQRIGTDLNILYATNFGGKATEKMIDSDLTIYFDPEAKDRQYYRIYQDGENNKSRGNLIVREKLSDDLEALAIFYVPDFSDPKDMGRFSFKDKLQKNETVNFLDLTSFILHNTQTNVATDISASWLRSQEALRQAFPDKTEEELSKINRRIGLLPRSAHLNSGATIKAVAGIKTILLSDTQYDQPFNIAHTLGAEKTPALNRWFATMLIAEKAIQHVGELTLPEKATIAFITELISMKPSQPFKIDLKFRHLRLLIKEFIFGLESEPPATLVKIEREAILNAMGKLLLLRKLGVDVCPGIGIGQMANACVKYLKTLDEIYPQLWQKYGMRFASSRFYPIEVRDNI